jgi:hypothetical protein
MGSRGFEQSVSGRRRLGWSWAESCPLGSLQGLGILQNRGNGTMSLDSRGTDERVDRLPGTFPIIFSFASLALGVSEEAPAFLLGDMVKVCFFLRGGTAGDSGSTAV